MTASAFDNGLDLWASWTTGTYRALLLKNSGYTFNAAHQFVAALSPGSNECARAGYSRQTIGSKSRAVDSALHHIFYDCADPAFGSIAAGDTITAMVLYLFGTSDADSTLMAYYPLTPTVTDGTAFTPSVGALGLALLAQA